MIPNEADLGRWREQLAQVSPRHDHLSYLWLRWEPGDPWQPVERWVIWQMLPETITHNPKHPYYLAILAELNGPHPRSTGRYDAEEQRWVHGPCRLIDLGTWETFRETGRFGRRWWVIQGTKGGHRYRLSEAERVVWRTLTGTDDTPAPGDLPYAPFDNRVLDQIRGLDEKTKWLAVMSYGIKNRHQLDADEQQEVAMAKRAVANWLAGQMEEVYEEYGSLLKRATADFAPTRLDPKVEASLVADYHIG
ncbi:MAG: hypothetical protein A4C66_03235 [Nitrospira sp. HN-bin3]|nr:MAG: hypothetical protein A4C66_03235 [Nitrospira sp. HN-bin3]